MVERAFDASADDLEVVMMRGSVLPQGRDALWALLADRLDVIESGLALVKAGFDCSDGQFGLVDGLARDARGAPVLVIVAVDGDPLLAPRALSAAEFLVRVGDGFARAVPEANLCPGVPGRVLVVGGSGGAGSIGSGAGANHGLELMRRLALPGVEVCRLEGFRLAGAERLVARWVGTAGRANATSPETLAAFEVPTARCREWEAVQRLCEKLDPAIRIDGDRFQRRITWHGRSLGQLAVNDGDLFGVDERGRERRIFGDRDVRAFGDTLLRRYVHVAGLSAPSAAAPAGGVATRSQPVAGESAGADLRGAESLREALTASRLSVEEYSALDEPSTGTLPDVEALNATNPADYVAQIVGEPTRPWPPPKRTE